MQDIDYAAIAKELMKQPLFSDRGASAIGWSEQNLARWLRDECRCVYCEKPMLESFITMQFDAQCDHLLPKVIYGELADEPSNLVLACTVCNKVKGSWDPNLTDPVYLKGSSTPLEPDQRKELIRRVKEVNRKYEESLKGTFEEQKKTLLRTCEELSRGKGAHA
jgi:hypothetical protein